MSQTRYGYPLSAGAAGGIVDTAPYSILSRINEEETGAMKMGLGVVQGSIPGSNVALPADGATAAQFEGFTVNNHHTEYDLEGKLHIRNGAAIGVMAYGKVYARVAEGVAPSYGDNVYVIVGGEEAGFVTNQAGAEGTTTIAIKARFVSGVDGTTKVAAIELFNQAQA